MSIEFPCGVTVFLKLARLLGLGVGLMANLDVSAAELTGPLIMRLPTAAGTQQAGVSNRLVIDDAHTMASVDEARREIRIANNHAYGENAIVADVLLHAKGQWGTRSRPYLIHLVISKDSNGWHNRLSTYTVPGAGSPDGAEVDGWTVMIGQEKQVVLTPDQAQAQIVAPPFSSRLIDTFAQVRDIRTAADPSPALDISLGIGPFKYTVAAARLELPLSLKTDPKRNLDKALQEEDWHFEMAMLSSMTPKELIRHDLLLFGLDTHPLFLDVMRRGYRTDEKLTVGVQNGAGFVRIGAQNAPFPAAQQTVMTFLHDTYVGMVLAAQGKLIESR